MNGRTQQRAQLRGEQIGPAHAQAQRAHAQKWIVLVRHVEVGQRLIAANVDRANDHRAAGHGFERAAIGGVLLVFAGRRGAVEKQEFGAEQPDPLGAMLQRQARLIRVADVGPQRQPVAIGQLAGQVAQRLPARAFSVQLGGTARVVGALLGIRLGDQQRRRAVEDHLGVVVDIKRCRAKANHGGNAQRARQNCGVAGRPAVGRGEACDRAAAQLGRLSRRQVGCDDDRAGGQFASQPVTAVQRRQNLLADRIDIGGALAQIRVVERRRSARIWPTWRQSRRQRRALIAHQPRDLIGQR